jgi:predicted phosphodiesterase
VVKESSPPPSVAFIEATLQKLYDSAPRVALSEASRIVILSDLHLGDGGPRDDFRHNEDLVQRVLRDYYLAGGYSLVLNGDIEELQRFRLKAIEERWAGLYAIFQEFAASTALYKIFGNHDEGLQCDDGARRQCKDSTPDPRLLEALRFTYRDWVLFVFHGHQATVFFERFNDVSGFFLRYFANALRIRNPSGTYESGKKYRTEHRVYSFASRRKIVSIIGHTHRPLFESLSKIDTIRFRLEQLCRDYPAASPRVRGAIEKLIDGYKQELNRIWATDKDSGLRSSLYNDQISIPCLFNSGCAIGKRGVTAIEIVDGAIALVSWFDQGRGERHFAEAQQPAQRLDGSDYFRSVLKQDRLDYIFSRINLLA